MQRQGLGEALPLSPTSRFFSSASCFSRAASANLLSCLFFLILKGGLALCLSSLPNAREYRPKKRKIEIGRLMMLSGFSLWLTEDKESLYSSLTSLV